MLMKYPEMINNKILNIFTIKSNMNIVLCFTSGTYFTYVNDLHTKQISVKWNAHYFNWTIHVSFWYKSWQDHAVSQLKLSLFIHDKNFAYSYRWPCELHQNKRYNSCLLCVALEYLHCRPKIKYNLKKEKKS
jgi:hypothetical protein